MDSEKDHLALYSHDCLNCGHLVQGASVKHSKCHATKGNKLCPANDVVIVITGKIDQLVLKLKKARKAKDAQAEAKLWAKVVKEPAAVQQRIYDLLA